MLDVSSYPKCYIRAIFVADYFCFKSMLVGRDSRSTKSVCHGAQYSPGSGGQFNSSRGGDHTCSVQASKLILLTTVRGKTGKGICSSTFLPKYFLSVETIKS